MVGETMRYVATDADGVWVALVGFASPALSCQPRDRFIGWSPETQLRRLRFVASNQRFCVLPAGRRPNAASAVMARTLARLSADWTLRWGHPVLLVETFVDPSRHVGTCYGASAFLRVGQTAGFARRSGRYVEHGVVKDVYVRALHRHATLVLAGVFDHPLLSVDPKGCVALVNFNTADLSSLLGSLALVTDPRHRRGIRHGFAPTLALAACATLAGHKSLVAISEWVDSVPQEVLARVGARRSPATRKYVTPSYATIRRALDAVDPQELDDIINRWAATQNSHPPAPTPAPPIAAGKGPGDEHDDKPDHNDHHNDDRDGDRDEMPDDDDDRVDPHIGDELRGIAVDGKSLRGARKDDGTRIHLLSALTHDTRAVIGQRDVDNDKTNEIKIMCPLLANIDITGHVITADALHTQQAAARYIVARSAHYLFGVKGNQPTLHRDGLAAIKTVDIDTAHHQTIRRGHGRIDRHRVWVVPVPEGTGFAHAAQFVLVERESSNLNNERTSIETRIYVTDLTAVQASPVNLLRLTRGHWAIEANHWIRDVTYNEDHSQIRVGTTARVMATLRNLAISAIRHAAGVTVNIAAATRQLARQPTTTLDLLGIPQLTPRLCK